MNLQLIKEIIESLTLELTPQLIQIRRHLHQYPELGRQEKKTTKYLVDLLATQNLEINLHTDNADKNRLVDQNHLADQNDLSGFWADLIFQPNVPFLVIRCDIDALPITELNDVEYKSKHHGIMHACGHDVHSAVVMGAAIILSQLNHKIKGNIRFLFQPAEELTPGGANDMLARGVLEQAEAIWSLHVDPAMSVGKVGIKSGPLMASTDIFKIRIIGKGGHAAIPHKSIDPILIGAQLINALNHLVSRNIDPVSPAVLTITRFDGGTSFNIIPNEVELWGTMRSFNNQTRKFLQKRLKEITAGVCQVHHAKFEITIDEGAPPVINDKKLTELFTQSAQDILDINNVIELENPFMGAEDFAWYLEKVPGFIFRLGTSGRNGTDFDLHHPQFDVDENSIAVGVKAFCWSIVQYFNRKSINKI